jgi:hypothetical protein
LNNLEYLELLNLVTWLNGNIGKYGIDWDWCFPNSKTDHSIKITNPTKKTFATLRWGMLVSH